MSEITQNNSHKSQLGSDHPVRRLRAILFATVATLLMIGAVMVFSSSAVHASFKYNDSLFYLKRHILYLVIGSFVCLWAMSRDLKAYRIWAFAFAVGICILLLYTALFTQSIHGARRWLRIGPISLQTSEFAKVVLLYYFADYFSRFDAPITHLSKRLVQPAIIFCFATMSILIGKDLGSCAVVGFMFSIIVFSAGLSRKYIFKFAAIVTPLFLLAIWVEPYRRQRLLTFMNPWDSAQDAGFQLTQSLIAIGSGGWFGVGLGQSQQKLLYLPEAHNDFIFAIIAEETGFFGSFAVIALYVCFALFGWLLIKKISDPFSRFFCLGAVAIVSIEAMINIGVNIGVLPTKGIVLPFISYGGSSLVARLLLFGMVLNFSRDTSG